MADPRVKDKSPSSDQITSEVELVKLKDEEGGITPNLSGTVKSKSGLFGSVKNKLKLGEEVGTGDAKGQADQAKMLRQNRIFVVAKEGSVAEMKDLVGDPKDPKVDVMARGSFGETILHIACLFANFPVAKYLVANFPSLIDAIYEKEPYVGEAALHIAIVQADTEMVEFLLQHGAEINNIRCVGSFFRPPTGKIYLGEHPLTFAACVEREGKNREMVRLLLKYGASFFNQDELGNTILHVLVIHSKVEMYGYIMDLYNLYKKPTDPDLEQVKNKQGRTPLCLAAALAKGEVFELIMKRKKETLWIYGPMAANAYPISELDTFHPESKFSTALELVVYLSGEWGNTEESEMRRAELLDKTPMRELVHSKWNSYIKKVFYLWLFIYVIYVIIFSMVIIRPPYLFPDQERTTALFALEIIVCLYALFSFLLEVRDMFTLRLRYFTEKGSRLFYFLAWVNSILIGLAFIFRMTGDFASEEIVTTLAALTTYFYSLYFARGFKDFGFFVVSIREILVRDLSRFILVYLIIVCGFCLSFMTLFRRASLPGFDSFEYGLYSMFKMTLLDFDDMDLGVTNNLALTILLQIVFIFVVSILLLNMLIAMMGDTYSNVREKSEKQYVLEWVSIVLLIERRLPWFIRKWKRSGQPNTDIGLASEQHFLIVEEKTFWGESAAKSRLRFIFKNAVRKIIMALKMRRGIMGDPKKRSSFIDMQARNLEKQQKEEKEKRKSTVLGDLSHMFDDMGELIDEMQLLKYESGSNIGGAM